ncbi:hypothetical protein V1292_005503 [Bradyrhizobium sp. AZCC 1719]
MTLSAYIRCQVFGSPSATVSKAKAAGDVDQRIKLAEMRGGSVDGLFGYRGIGEVDAADFEQIRRGGDLRRGVIDTCNPGALRQRFVHDHPAERTQRARHDNDFSVHEGPPHADEGAHLNRRFSIPMRRISA